VTAWAAVKKRWLFVAKVVDTNAPLEEVTKVHRGWLVTEEFWRTHCNQSIGLPDSLVRGTVTV
jgi:hypothetical protein